MAVTTNAPDGFTCGFSFWAQAADGATGFVVNVCGHPSVGGALARSMDPVPESFIDAHGVDNLIVPISVGTPTRLPPASAGAGTGTGLPGAASYAIDVVVSPALAGRCRPGHPRGAHLVERLTALAVDWVLREAGVRLAGPSCRLIAPPPAYYAAPRVPAGEDPKLHAQLDKLRAVVEEAKKAAAAAGGENARESSADDDGEGSRVPASLANIVRPAEEARGAGKGAEPPARKGPLIQEMDPSPAAAAGDKGGAKASGGGGASGGLRKGFLVSEGASARRPLYGPGGSSEGEGKRPDPLAHLPRGLRDRCQIVDLSQQQPTQPQQPPPSKPSPPSPVPAPRWRVESVAAGGADGQSVVVRFADQRPPGGGGGGGGGALAGVDLSAEPRAVTVDGVAAALPCDVDPDSAAAKYVKSKRVLVVTCRPAA